MEKKNLGLMMMMTMIVMVMWVRCGTSTAGLASLSVRVDVVMIHVLMGVAWDWLMLQVFFINFIFGVWLVGLAVMVWHR